MEKALNGRHDIGLVCMMNYNIGNNITNYALYSVLLNMGFTVQLIDIPSSVPESAFFNKNGPFYYFLKSPYPNHAVYKPADFWELYESDNWDFYVVGSDQLWRSRFLESTEFHATLNWAFPHRYKMSYGTSMGVTFDTKDDRVFSKMIQYLKRFSAISVREEFAKELLAEKGIEAQTVLDPVFICERKYFDELADRGSLRLPDSKYAFGYFLDPDDRKEEMLLNIANEKCDGVYLATTEPTYQEIVRTNLHYSLEPCVEEWVSMIKNAEYVITDSFHGMCFALIYNKPFWVIYDKDNWRGVKRFIDFLEKLGLISRLILNDAEINFDNEIDYQSINSIISDMKNNSLKWLEQAINKRIGYIGEESAYDYYLNTLFFQQLQSKLALESIRKNNSDMFFSKRSRDVNISRKEADGMVVGWGAGFCFRKNQEIIEKYCDIRFVCDNNPDLWGISLTDEIICISPAELLKLNNPFVLIMVESASAAISISNTLIDMGISRFDHVYNWINSIETKEIQIKP